MQTPLKINLIGIPGIKGSNAIDLAYKIGLQSYVDWITLVKFWNFKNSIDKNKMTVIYTSTIYIGHCPIYLNEFKNYHQKIRSYTSGHTSIEHNIHSIPNLKANRNVGYGIILETEFSIQLEKFHAYHQSSTSTSSFDSPPPSTWKVARISCAYHEQRAEGKCCASNSFHLTYIWKRRRQEPESLVDAFHDSIFGASIFIHQPKQSVYRA